MLSGATSTVVAPSARPWRCHIRAADPRRDEDPTEAVDGEAEPESQGFTVGELSVLYDAVVCGCLSRALAAADNLKPLVLENGGDRVVEAVTKRARAATAPCPPCAPRPRFSSRRRALPWGATHGYAACCHVRARRVVGSPASFPATGLQLWLCPWRPEIEVWTAPLVLSARKTNSYAPTGSLPCAALGRGESEASFGKAGGSMPVKASARGR